MKRLLSVMLAIMVIAIATAYAEEWICPVCENSATGNFCSNCGTPKPSDEWICPNCSKTMKGNFCSNCGTKRPEVTKSVPEPTVTVTLTSGKEIVIRESVKDFLDTYEEFMDGYKDAMTKISNGDYSAYMTFWTKYVEFAEKSEEIEGELTDDEALYYLEVTTRILQKMY